MAHGRGECMVFGTYAHTIDPISIGGSTLVSGAFEGLLICKCEA